ncbi:Signal transduction histidine kinase [Variovorax sp. HW608]|uniref:ATP-binding protein n=1 Tax=Variovorax sp. HW608 TaxID=1034889 RepID=UPI00081F938D|nr:ATP-binding protein [Variovorax sp. HW608]SCK22278.1 Signal transduction histidine kinase [Variovorax sp. HW608]
MPLPRTLLARITLVVVAGMVIAQALTFMAIRYERGQAMQTLMISGVERDIASSIAVLDRVPASERPGWLDRLERPNFRFALTGDVDTPAPASGPLRQFVDVITAALKPYPVLAVGLVPSMREAVRMQVRLGDGSSVYLLARRVPMPMSEWVIWLLLAQLVVLGLCAWQAARWMTRPLKRLGDAADALGPDLRPTVVDENGPVEVARTARAFNAMQRRIAGYVQERIQILAAVSHDLQTPITRMRLRVDLMDDELPERDKFRQDLESMRSLVQEGVSYARTLQGSTEAERRVDVGALLQSIVNDYADTGQPVTLAGDAGEPVATRPNALRRVVGNLVDNALKFGTKVEVRLSRIEAAGGAQLHIAVRDDGPGIPPDQLEAVLQPFYRVEGSRSRETGGTGLGLAIAHQLTLAMGGELVLSNRAEGGLEALLRLPV